MSDVRRRQVPSSSKDEPIAAKIRREDAASKSIFSDIGVLDVLRLLGGILLLNTTLSYFITGDKFLWGVRPWFTQPGQLRAYLNGPLSLTDAQLAAYDGSDPSKPIYLALNGTIYDVSAGTNYYGPGGMYGFFSGKDATRAFITGCFDSDLNPDTRGIEEMYVPLPDEEKDAKFTKAELKTRRERELRAGRKKVLDGLEGWAKVFRGDTGKNYFKVGEVKREEGWLEKMPVKELCDGAKAKRKPRRPGQ